MLPRSIVSDATTKEFDLIVVGGGVTGAACARDASLRGLDVLLLEKDDIASGTSSRSSKLIHGGLRYLETYQFKLVAESLRERELSVRLAPHHTRIEPFLYLLYEGDQYGKGLLNFALTFYDVASGNLRERRHEMMSKADILQREPGLNANGLKGGGLFYDAFTDDARYTLDIAKGAAEHGASILTYMTVTGLVNSNGNVTGVRAYDDISGVEHTFRAKQIVNATGPWASRLLEEEHGQAGPALRPSKGVHIVLDKKDFPLNTALFIRSPDDGRVTWPMPSMEDDRIFVGTTDTEYDGDPDGVVPDEHDIEYLLNVANHTMPDAKIDESKIIGSWAGLRPLIAPSPGTPVGSASREHKVDVGPGGMITITGGKLTSNRVMAKHVVDEVFKKNGLAKTRYRANKVPISGGNEADIAGIRVRLARSEVPANIASRWIRYYGANAVWLLDLWESGPEMQEVIAPRGITLADLHYAVRHEFCRSLEDFMVRRTSLFFWDAHGGIEGAETVATHLAALLDWTPEEQARQISEYRTLVEQHRPPFANTLSQSSS